MTEKAAVESLPDKPDVGKRIRAIEKRHGKEFTEVLADMHDHIFGATSEEPEEAGEPVASDVTDGEGNVVG